ncbi:helix-turn-helix domain-containing protein [Micromonospora sp. C51]|uniref:Scr1 family TA system antitoxin-like transcriptional regulator n=1 Tax=Micromonospora sp. C51 TaxID=2824879 RepID=UPI001B37C067|nr:Scr1 family TA system antitoxin-like transcriptional regulator [Micromonospora sp. C51]MBQ1047877.1 helix-turn-helix domain-containing protein [Micromonospora sp. C51]
MIDRRESRGAATSRRTLRLALRRLREERGLSIDDVRHRMKWSTSKAIRIESGAVGIKPSDLRLLLDLYEVDDAAVRQQLLDLAGSGRRRTWVSAFRDSAPPVVMAYLAREAESRQVAQFDPSVVPELLQCRRYAELAARSPAPRIDPQHRAEMTMCRQRELGRHGGPTQLLVVYESSLRRIGDVALYADQVVHLRQLARHPNIQVVVVPTFAEVFPPTVGPVTVAVADDCLVAHWGWQAQLGGRVIEDPEAAAHLLAGIEDVAARGVGVESISLTAGKQGVS